MFAARTCGNADNASLLRGTLGSADNELVLALDPEVRRIGNRLFRSVANRSKNLRRFKLAEAKSTEKKNPEDYFTNHVTFAT